jgi:uroporphyrinogen-III synthase
VIPLVVIRPRPGCDATVAAARDMGLEAHGFPLFEVRPLDWDAPEPDSFDAVLVGSANALRHGGEQLLTLAGKPAYAVGEATARACREAGLAVVATGEGGLQEVLAHLDPSHRSLLRLAGATRLSLDPPPGVTLIERTVYASEPVSMPAALAGLLRQPAVIALHSAEAARHFRAQCEAQAIDLSLHSLAAIGPRVAEAAGQGWRSVRAAGQPDEAALLALVAEMCKESAAQGANASQARDSMADPVHEATAPPPVATPAPRRSSRWPLLLALLAFLLGGAGTVWLASKGYLEDLGLVKPAAEPVAAAAVPAPRAADETPAPGSADDAGLKEIAGVETRIAMIENRLSRIDLQSNAASGNAARAEALLIAFATRRMVDRGEPLRFLADQLRLRFSNAQPRAVNTIIAFSRNPVTADQLAARLEALTPDLTGTAPDTSLMDRALNDISNLFTVRREPSEVISPKAAVERARVMLRGGRVEEAIAQVKRLPGAAAADKWIADAQRYADVQDALDLIETAAMLEPSRLKDASGQTVSDPSALARPPARPDARPE